MKLRLVLVLAAVPFLSTAHAQFEDETLQPTRLVKVSREKLQQAVIKALLEKKAEFHGITKCEQRCGQPNEDGSADREIEYKDNRPWSYKIPYSKTGGHVAIITAEKYPVFLHKYFVLPLTDCRDFFEKIRRGRKPISIGDEPYKMNIEYGRISLGEDQFDLNDSFCENLDYPGEGEERSFSIRSIAGPVVTVMRWSSGASEGSRPSASLEWISWNLEENRPAQLTDLFEKDSILKVMKADKVMRQRFFRGRVAALEQATEVEILMKAVKADPRQRFSPLGWHIVSFNRETKIANVHMGFYGNCCNSGKMFRMGFALRVRADREELFKKSLRILPDPWTYDPKRKRAIFESRFSEI